MRHPNLMIAAVAATMIAPIIAARAEIAEVPVDVGVGPAAYFLSGPVFDDQPVHLGLKISVAAVLDRAFIEKHQARVPARYRKMALRMSEIRFAPSLLIPDAIFLSPPLAHTGMFGSTWRPIAVNLPLTDGDVRFRVGVAALLTYFYLHSDTLPSTHFFRPGADLAAEMEIRVTSAFLVSVGWSSGFYIPQRLGAFGTGGTKESVWHIGQAFLKLHFRSIRKVRI